MRQVFLAECSTYDQVDVDTAVDRIFSGLDLPRDLFRPGQSVFLKVNLLLRKKPEEAITTHPAVVEAVARKLKAIGLHVVIGDSPGGPFTPMLLKGLYRTTGMEEAARRTGSELNFNVETITVPFPEGRLVKSLTVAKAIWEADRIVNLAKLKTHGMMVFTGAVKNLFGVIPGLLKAEYHLKMPEEKDFAALLVDICNLISPTLSIIDGIVAMDGHGPSSGNPYPLNALIAGEDPYAVDAAACGLVGLPPDAVPYLRLAGERGLLAEKAEILGVSSNKLQVNDFQIPTRREIKFYQNRVPRWLERRLTRALTPSPHFQHQICTGCGVCQSNCPPQVIRMEGGKPVADLNACIRCFCCQELCPSRAVLAKRPWLTDKFLRG